MLPKALKSYPKSNKLPNQVTLIPTSNRDRRQVRVHFISSLFCQLEKANQFTEKVSACYYTISCSWFKTSRANTIKRSPTYTFVPYYLGHHRPSTQLLANRMQITNLQSFYHSRTQPGPRQGLNIGTILPKFTSPPYGNKESHMAF